MMAYWLKMKDLAAKTETDEMILWKYCCPECIESNMQVSNHDFCELQFMVMECIKDPLGKTDPHKLKDVVMGKVYEYLCYAGYEQYDLSLYSPENQHLVPVWIERKVNMTLGTGEYTLKKLYCKRTFFEWI